MDEKTQEQVDKILAHLLTLRKEVMVDRIVFGVMMLGVITLLLLHLWWA